ncbi:MAG: S-layer family protein [Fibrobacter sp.]|nr:S-layer family protein [Fibrobacter sp.]
MKTTFHAFFLCALTALFAASAGWAADVELQGDAQTGYYINMPATRTDNLTLTADDIAGGITSFKVYDDGGVGGEYSSNASGALQVTAPAGYVFQVTGSSYTESSWDYFRVYDGASDGEILYENAGLDQEIDFTGSRGSITFSITSDGSVTRDGVNLTVTLVEDNTQYSITLNQSEGGTVTSDVESAIVGTEVTVNLNVDAGYSVANIVIEDADGGAIEYIDGIAGNEITVTFVMPAKNVSITPTFVTPRPVSIATVTMGSMESDVTEAILGTTVTLTAIPEEGALFRGVTVVGDDDGLAITTNVNGNTATFVMPNQPVTITPKFANPNVITFDENGCLSNGTYFHVSCDGSECTVSQGLQDNPNEGVTDFTCWYREESMSSEECIDYDEDNDECLEWGMVGEDRPEEGVVVALAYAETIKLGSDLNLGGYNGTNCAMRNFVPIAFDGVAGVFDGQGNTVKGFCYEDLVGARSSMGFIEEVKSVSNVTFDNAHVVVKNTSGSVVGVVTDYVTWSDASFTNVHVTNSYVAGTQVGAFAGASTANSGMLSISTSSVVDTKVYGLNVAAVQGVGVSAAGGFLGYTNGNGINVLFSNDTVRATTAGATVVADDASYTGTGESYRGGFVGQVSASDAVTTVTNSHVSGLSISGNGNSNVGAVAGQIVAFDMLNTKLEDISVSGANAGGAAGQVAGESFNVTMSTDTIAGLSAIAGRTSAGGLVGYVELSSTAGAMTTSLNYLTVMADVSGGNSAGGLVGEILVSSEVGSTLSVEHVSVAGSVGATAAGMTADVNVGGLFGKVAMGTMNPSTLTVNTTAFNGNVNFTNTGVERTLYMGALLGNVNVAKYTIYGNYSNGEISYTGIDAANANVGYIGGYADLTGETAIIVGNYHYGADAVATGLGNISAADWKTDNGDYVFLANARNASDGLTDDGAVGFYYYEVSGGPSGASYMDLFAADLSSGTFSRVANGIASETEMKSPMFAAAMNYVQDMNGGVPTWTQTDGNLPAIATPLEKPNYLLPVIAKGVGDGDNDAFASLTTDQRNEYGVRSIAVNVNVSETPASVTMMMEGLVGYTDANGHPNKALVDSLQAIIQALEENDAAPYLNGEGNIPTVLTTNTVFTEAIDFIGVFLREEGKKTYEVVYQYCDETCTNVEDLADKTILLMSPKVESVASNQDAYSTLIPHAMVLDDPNEFLSVSVSYQDASGDAINDITYGNVNGFVSFANVVDAAYENSAVAKFVVQYRSGGAIPSFDIENPTMSDLNVDVYGLNASGERTLITSVSVPEQNATVPYGSSFVPRFGDKVGYAIESYTVSFTVTNPGEDRCDVIEPLPVVESESKSIAPWEELVVEQSPCKSKTWTVAGLTPGEDEVDLTNVKIAKARNESESFWKESFSIVPNYVAKPYNIVFHFNLTDNHFELDDDIYTLFKTGYNNPENTLDLEENSAFPLFYGVDDGFDYINIAGWTLDESKANCVMDEEGCFTSSQINNGSVAFTSLTANLITAAADAGLLVTNPENPGDPQTMQLYPVWEKQRNTWMANAVVIGSCEQHGAKCYEYPINFTLSQDFSLNGNPVRIQVLSGVVVVEANPTKYGRGVRYYNYANNVYPFDFTYEVTPGFKVTSVTPPMYNEETSKLEITGSDNPAVLVDFSVLSYNVKFNLDAIGNDVYLGRGVRSSGVMSYEDGKYMFPPVYSRPTYGDDFEMDDYYRTNVFYGKHNWSVKNGDAYEGGSRDFDSKLVGLFEGNEHYVPAANEDENASITLYANYVEPMPMSGSSNYTEVADEIRVCALDEENACIDGDGSEYHGSVVLSQSYDNDAENVHWSFEHASEPVVQRAEDYETEENFVRHIIYVPSQDDTLTFDVSVRPDPGYTMAISDFTFSRNFDGIPQTNAEPVNWNYVAADAISGTLNIQPHAMGSMIFKVRYTQLAYNVAFLRPDPDLGLFVGNKSADGNYQMDWLESADGVTAETVHAPAVYDGNGCRIAWKVAGREVESRTNTDVVNELPFMAVIGNDADNPVVNTLELDAEHVVANECSGSYQLMLDVEGEGDVYFIQKIGAEPVEDSDPEQTIVKHVFVRAGDEAPMTLSIPKVFDKNGTEAGVKLTVVAVPAEGYVLNTLSYDVMFNGNSVTVLAQDSTELNIMENQNWHVKFEQYKPVYVTYDLALGEEDSSNVWIPADAVVSGSLQIGADGSDAPMWIPYRTDKCFAGWSTYNPNGSSPRPELMPMYTEVSTMNIDDFSSDMASPTPLYALWVEYAEGCSQPSVSASLVLRYIDDNDNVYLMGNGGELVVTQNFGEAVFEHRANGASVAFNPAGYKITAQVVSGTGYELDESAPDMSAYADYYDEGSWHTVPLEDENGVYTIGDDNRVDQYGTGSTYYFGHKEKEIEYSITYNLNADNANVFYGENWTNTPEVTIDTKFNKNVYRADACLVGWSFDQNAVVGDENIFRDKVNADFVNAYSTHVANGNDPVLYAVWSDNGDNCIEPLATVAVATLSDGLKGKASVELVQEIDGESRIVAVIGSEGVSIPKVTVEHVAVNGNTEVIGDLIYFTKMNVVPNVGYSLSETVVPTYQIGGDAPVEIAEGMVEFNVQDDMVITATAQAVPYNVVYHENAGDAPVFYGEHWSSTATLNVGDSMTMSIFRTDACLAGWMFNDNGLVYQLADADFIAELASLEIDGDIDLYAVWSADGAACLNPIQNVAVSLSDDLKGKATVELLQEVEGESKVVATVGAEGATIPKVTTREVSVNGGTEVVGDFAYFSGLRMVPAAGYALSETVATTYKEGDAEAVEVTADPQPWTMTANTVISGAVDPVSYTVAFDVNAGSANVFYPSDWPENASAVQYDITMDEDTRQFPKVYRTDKCLVRYGFSKDASKAESFAAFDADFVNAYDSVVASGVQNPVLYAVWNECSPEQTLYTVTLNEPVEGTLVLSQHGNSYEVPSTGLKVPAAPLGIVFTVSFNVNDGYKLDDNGVFSVDDGSGEFVALEDGLLVVDGDKIVDAPATGKPYTFAFDVNVEEGVNVFYGDAWKASDNFALATEDVPFPTAVYRVGACLDGWTISKDAATAYTHYNAEFVAAVENANKAGLAVSTLYAKWGDCDPEQTVVTVSNSDAAAGTFTLSRTVSGTTAEYAVGETALQVPADEALDFTVSYAVNKGYTYNAMNGISAVDAADAPVEINDDVLNVAASLTLSASVSPDVYIFALDENAGEANVFYTGTLAERFTAKVSDDADTRALPMNLYRTDACLVGWNFSKTATTGFTEFSGDVVAAYEEAGTGTLYAVWDKGCEQVILTVTSADKGKGVLTLAQGNRSFEVDDGLLVPYTENGIAFTADFVPAAGYAYDGAKGFTAYSAQGTAIGTLENDAVTVAESMTIAANGLAESEFAITFDVNAGDATVYYGNPAEGASPKYTYAITGQTVFPMNFYRTDACLTGWRVTAAPAEGETVFTDFETFVAAVDGLANYTGTLYAVWGTCSKVNNVTVAQVAPEMGTLTLVQRDANGNAVNTTEIVDAAVTLPLGNGDVEFAIEYTPNPGYSKVDGSYFYTVDENGNNLAALVNDRLELAGNTIVKAPAKADAFAVVFDVNAAAGVNVFYGNGWNASGSYDISMAESELAFPTEVYRVGYKLVGWSLEPMADGEAVYYTAEGGPSGYENTYQKYDENSAEVLKANGTSSVTMYAVWMPDANQTKYTVALTNPNAGSLTLSQNVAGAQSITVGSDALEVPAVSGGLLFAASAELNSGYFANGNTLYLIGTEGNRVPLIDGVLSVDGNKNIEIPVESDGVQFVFAENTDAHVFYEDGWNNTGFFSLEGTTEFPKGLLRTDAEFLGWALSPNSSKYYRKYDEDFVADLRNARMLGMQTETLYAVWMEYGVFDNVVVSAGNEKNGSFYISQTVNGIETTPLEVGANGIEIPSSSKLTFNVRFELNAGYYISSEEALQSRTIEGEALDHANNGGTMHLGEVNSVLQADVAATRYMFAYNVNADGTNVFYGDDWSSHEEKTVDDEIHELPHNIYRADARLVGWSTDSTATEGSFDMSSEFVQNIGHDNTTLYAVWEPAEVETYRVSFANTNVGSLVLTQDVEDSIVAFDVSDTGLVVPVVESGLRFRAAYTLKAGYAGSTDSLYRVDDLGEFIATLASGELTVDQDVTLAIPTAGESYKIVFDVNREENVLFRGSDWVDSRTYMMTGDSSSFPLPAYLYTADACMVGWSLSKKDGEKLYTEFTSDLVEELLMLEPVDSAYTLYAIWGDGSACDDAYNRISLQSVNGSVKLVEVDTEASESPVEHVFATDNTIILPKVVNGNMLHVVSIPDSSYVLDSLVTVRLGGEERLATFEGGSLPSNLSEAYLVAYFGKANRSAIAFVDTLFSKTGNAVRFKFTTSEFEVTRGVSARVVLETLAGEIIAVDTLSDSIVPPYQGVWERYPLAAGQYVLTATLSDENDTVEYVHEFEVTAEIAAVSAEGWQMISIGNLDKETLVWDDDQKFFWWDESGTPGEFWQYKQLTQDEEIDPARGYWYSSIEGRPLILKPDVEDSNIDNVVWQLDSINSGWNLVANPLGFALDLYGDHPEENVDPTEESRTIFYHWNSEMSDYEEVTVVGPYEAVWVKASASTEWLVPVRPKFAKPSDSLDLDSSAKSLNKRALLAKADGLEDWRIKLVLSDAKGHRDSWNMLGASRRPFASDEPPEGMGDHVKLSVLEGNRMLAKSVKASADEYEWKISLNASSERYGELRLEGISGLNAYGLKVFVTVDGKTTEMHEGDALSLLLKPNAIEATVFVGSAPKVALVKTLAGLKAVQAGAMLQVDFDAGAGLAGSAVRVDVLDLKGNVVRSVGSNALAGVNRVTLNAPKPGIYMLRVRAGSQMKAGRILVK